VSIERDNERIGQALQALRSADGDVRAGTAAEVRAVLAFRRQHRRRGFERLAIAAAVGVIGLVAIGSYRIHENARPTVRGNGERPATLAMAADSKEVLTPFFPLMASASNLEHGLIIRVTVPAAVMRRVGLQVGEGHLADPVQAEVLVGQDALARAIRFVTYRQ
jgi:hypothetical protein